MALLDKHKFVERNATLLLVGSLFVVSIGGIVEIVPLFYLENTIEKVEGMRPYSPLELAGRNIYIREGLLHLPQPDDPAVPRRGGALRPLQPSCGIHV
jgi:cbb3-type cytochrome oxidase cytochrome c subunit